MPAAIERAVSHALAGGSCEFGEILIRAGEGFFRLTHRDDAARPDLPASRSAEAALGLAKADDAGRYRPLKTAPNLAHGWLLELTGVEELRRALDYFYPGRLAVWLAWQEGRLETTTLRETLARQTGMYRAAAKVSDVQINEIVAQACRTETGCLRAILWRRDAGGARPSEKLPSEKFEPPGGGPTGPAIPLLCQEACGMLVSACRAAVKTE